MARVLAHLVTAGLAAGVCLSSVAARTGTQATTVQGEWHGAIELPGQPLRIEVRLTEEGGVWQGTISIPAQGIDSYGLSHVVVESARVAFRMPAIPGEPRFEGALAAERIRGAFLQGEIEVPFHLERARNDPNRDTLDLLVEDLVARAMAASQIPGIALAIVTDEGEVLVRGFGVRELGTDLPVSRDTVFPIGSATKAFTAFAIGTLVAEGTLAWDAPVAQYLPEFKLQDEYASRRLTVRDLLSHGSGLPRHDMVWYGADLRQEELLRRLAHLPMRASFRSEWQYQNMLYAIAGILAERVTNDSWPTLLRSRIFEPAGLASTRASAADAAELLDRATGHMVDDAGVRTTAFYRMGVMGPAGSVNSTAGDMGRWVQLLLGAGTIDGRRILEHSVVQETMTPQVAIRSYPADPRVVPNGYGLGWMLETNSGHYVAHHDGAIDGFSAWVGLAPRDRIGVVVLANAVARSPVPTLVGRAVLDAALELPAGPWMDLLESAHRHASPAQTHRAPRVSGTRPSTAPSGYAGVYAHPGYGPISVGVDDGELTIRYNTFSGTLEHWHFDTFVIRAAGTPLDRVAVSFRIDMGGGVHELLAPFEPTIDPIVFAKRDEI